MTAYPQIPIARIGAFAILFALIAFVWIAIVSPLWSAWERRAEQADRSAELIVHLRQAAAEAPQVQSELTKIEEALRNRSAILAASNVNLAGATLQSEVKRIVEAGGAQLRSMQQLPPVQEDQLNRIGVRLVLQGDTAQMAHILYNLEGHVPILLARNLSVHSDERQGTDRLPQSLPLNIQIDVTALWGVPE